MQGVLGEFYSQLVPQGLAALKVTERAIHCNQCELETHNNRAIKCCGFQPVIANFVVGALLETQELELINAYSSPVGLLPKKEVQKAHNKSRTTEGFSDLVCDFYNQGFCKIWELRNSTCRSFFCKSSYSLAGLEFWQLTEDYLYSIEMSILQLVLLETGYSLSEVTELMRLTDPDDHAVTDVLIKPSKSFYKDCFDVFNRKKEEWLPQVHSSLDKDLQNLINFYNKKLKA